MVDIEDQIPQSNGKTIKEFWKEKMIETLSTIYGEDGLRHDKLNQFLDAIIAKSHDPVAHMRNIYEESTWTVKLNDIPVMVNDNHLIIGANGTYTYRQYVRMSELSELLLLWLSNRSKLKKQAIHYEEIGDVSNWRKYENQQNSTKENINSSYGVSTMAGYILFSPDSASMITSQARELISEMLWTNEKLLGKNLVFKDVNELYSYINEIVRLPLSVEMLNKYKVMIPNFKMLTRRLNEYLKCIPKNERVGFDNNKSLFLMLKNIAKDPIKSINFYYRYNMYEFLKDNKLVMKIVNDMMDMDLEFNSPSREVMEKSESAAYIPYIEELTKVFIEFLIVPSPTYDRVDKYQTRGRYIVPISDTDSVIINFNEWIEFVSEYSTVQFDSFYDERHVFRVGNIMGYMCTEICNFMGRNMAKHCYVPKEYRPRIAIKNEFFFKSLIIYPNIKKNYSAWTRLREGALVNKIANTGLALTGSNINPFVSDAFEDIIKNEIHYTKDVSITRIMKRVYDLEASIRYKLIEEQDVSFGVFQAYKNNLRANVMGDSVIRGVEVWNWLYPDDKIESYNKVYVLNTILEREDQLHLVNDIGMREAIREIIFKNPIDPDIRKYGLRTIAIPDTKIKYPMWLKNIVDCNKLTERHINSMTALLPSIGVYQNRVKSNRNHISPLISL